MFAATHPESVSGLILYATAARGTQAPDYPWQWSEQEWHDYLVRLRAAYGTREYAEESLAIFNPSLTGDACMLEWWERFQRVSASPNAIYAQEQVFREMDIRRLLAAIGVPTLVLHRADDAIEPVGAGRFLTVSRASPTRGISMRSRTPVRLNPWWPWTRRCESGMLAVRCSQQSP